MRGFREQHLPPLCMPGPGFHDIAHDRHDGREIAWPGKCAGRGVGRRTPDILPASDWRRGCPGVRVRHSGRGGARGRMRRGAAGPARQRKSRGSGRPPVAPNGRAGRTRAASPHRPACPLVPAAPTVCNRLFATAKDDESRRLRHIVRVGDRRREQHNVHPMPSPRQSAGNLERRPLRPTASKTWNQDRDMSQVSVPGRSFAGSVGDT